AVKLKKWPYSKKVFYPHSGQTNEAPRAGEIWRQPDLLATLQKLVDAETQALKAGKDRKQAIYAAYDRFYKGDIAEEFCRGSREQDGLHTVADLAKWKVKIEEPATTTYKLIDWKKNDPDIRPGDPYAFERKPNPFLRFLTNWSNLKTNKAAAGATISSASLDSGEPSLEAQAPFDADFRAGTTSIQAADDK